MSPSFAAPRSADTAPGLPPKSAERALQVSRLPVQCAKARGGNPLPRPPVDRAVTRGPGAPNKPETNRKKQLLQPSRAQTDPDRAMFGVSRPSDGSSRAAR
ncbi:hypothetical protein NDU88_009029 [Pleurodeles waltl]|uniref:Uncharacterized protein n=1 Tax=Pleurodeles waltl TaxID=8319 RepID=A0AAV7QQD6_PLEWA|nr:hypothetical protein NDU88_009029 [Pleurodeles waltl]